MKKITLILALALASLFATSCNKVLDFTKIPKHYYDTTGTPAPIQQIAWSNWCNDSIAMYGDSFTEAAGAIPMSWYLADLMGIDTLVLRGNWQMSKGESKVRNVGLSGQTSTTIKNRFLLDTAYRSRAHIFWVGANNNWHYQVILDDVAEMVAALPHKKYIIMGIETGDLPDRWGAYDDVPATPYYLATKKVNDKLKEIYKDHYFDPVPGLQRRARPGNYEDSMSVVHGAVPPYLNLDYLHHNWEGYYSIAVDLYHDMLKKCD